MFKITVVDPNVKFRYQKPEDSSKKNELFSRITKKTRKITRYSTCLYWQLF